MFSCYKGYKQKWTVKKLKKVIYITIPQYKHIIAHCWWEHVVKLNFRCKCSVLMFSCLSHSCRKLGGIQKSCWTQLNTWATNTPATLNPSQSLNPPLLILPWRSCLSTPMLSTRPTSPCTPTRAFQPTALELPSPSPRSNPCEEQHNSLVLVKGNSVVNCASDPHRAFSLLPS